MKIILFGWNRLGTLRKGNWNHEFFRRELARQHDVVLWGRGYPGFKSNLAVADVVAQNTDVDMLMTHYEHREHALTKGLDKIDGIFKVHVMGGDYYRQLESYNDHLNRVRYDIIFSPTLHTMNLLKENKIDAQHYYLPLAVNTNKYYKQYVEKTIDVMAVGQIGHNHPHREEMKYRVANMKGIKTFTDAVWFDKYINTINKSKIFVSCSIQHHIILGKVTEAMACGTFLLTTKSPDLDRCGYKDGYHLVTYKDDFSDLEDKVRYFLEHEDEREEIAKNGMEFVHTMHSTKYRVKEFIHSIMWYKQSLQLMKMKGWNDGNLS